jgi:hypothetical protein
MRDVLPEIERRMLADFPDRLWAWRTDVALGKAARQRWRQERCDPTASGAAITPAPVLLRSLPEPQMPRLRQHDVTIEKVAELLARAAPKGLLIVRDELAGWIASMYSFNSGARAFWIEAYGGRPYRVERKRIRIQLLCRAWRSPFMAGPSPISSSGCCATGMTGCSRACSGCGPSRCHFAWENSRRVSNGQSMLSTGCASSIFSPATRLGQSSRR